MRPANSRASQRGPIVHSSTTLVHSMTIVIVWSSEYMTFVMQNEDTCHADEAGTKGGDPGAHPWRGAGSVPGSWRGRGGRGCDHASRRAHPWRVLCLFRVKGGIGRRSGGRGARAVG